MSIDFDTCFYIMKDLISDIGTNDAFIALFSALLGAIVGSFGGYYFNRLLEKQKSAERYWIQRKNTIYSPIYKELLALKEYCNEAFISTQHFDINFDENRHWRSYYTFNFTKWSAIQKDVRLDLIPKQLQQSLVKVTESLQLQIQLQKDFDAKLKELVSSFIKEINQINESVSSENYNEAVILRIVNEASRDFIKVPDFAEIKEYIMEHTQLESLPAALDLCAAFELKIISDITYIGRRAYIKTVSSTLDGSISLFRSYIVDIVEKYEGGVNLNEKFQLFRFGKKRNKRNH